MHYIINMFKLKPPSPRKKHATMCVDPDTKYMIKYTAYYMGLSMTELVRLAFMEFASRRLPTSWREESLLDEDFQEEIGEGR